MFELTVFHLCIILSINKSSNVDAMGSKIDTEDN